MHPVLRGEVVERQQLLAIIDDLRHRLGVLGPEQRSESRDGGLGVPAVLGVADLGQRLAGGGLGALWQAIEHVGHFVHLMPTSA
jgi:hypothetical protein